MVGCWRGRFNWWRADMSEQTASGELLIRITAMPMDTNAYGGVFGGWLMAQMVLGAGSLASRSGGGKAVVVSATDFAFPGVIEVGDELSVFGIILNTGNTSLTIETRAIARERNGEATTLVASGNFKFVLLDETGRPRAVGEAALSAE